MHFIIVRYKVLKNCYFEALVAFFTWNSYPTTNEEATATMTGKCAATCKMPLQLA